MNPSDKKIVIVLPAYNAEKTLLRTLAEIPPQYHEHTILIDDGSCYRTVELAREIGLNVFFHEVNRE